MHYPDAINVTERSPRGLMIEYIVEQTLAYGGVTANDLLGRFSLDEIERHWIAAKAGAASILAGRCPNGATDSEKFL